MQTETNKSNKHLTAVEAAKLIRADLKKAVKDGKLPDLKFGVRCDGRSMRIEFGPKDGQNMQLKNPVRTVLQAKFPRVFVDYHYAPNLSPEGKKIAETIKAIVDVYTYDNSDISTDYFDYNFYATISLRSESEADEAATTKAYEAGCAELGEPQNLDWNKNPYEGIFEIERRLGLK